MLRKIEVLVCFLLITSCLPQPSNLAILNTPGVEIQASADPVLSLPAPDPFETAREEMVAEQLESRGVTDQAVLEAMRIVPRHFFVPDEYLDRAYADHPLPIGYGQTISQPYIVALMSASLGVSPGARILEIGTGSGYQAAVLAEMGMEVYTVEIIPELAALAKEQLQAAGYPAVAVLNADGYFGWEAHAPFDAIMVTAAPDHLPQPLAAQLVEGGHFVIPIGPTGALQSLWLFTKVAGELEAANLGGVRFVPFTRARE